jgi:hypothetical protein
MNKHELLKQVYKSNRENKCYLDGESIDFIEKLVERATPIKIKINYNSASEFFNCPKCKKFHTYFYDLKYCHYCGQALDWSEL